MKTRQFILMVTLLAGCTWSNSLYRARELSGSARKAEREDRTFDAGSLWGRVAVKAESAWARDPEGKNGAEALWLRGLALSRLGDCSNAMPLIDAARFAHTEADWYDAASLEVGRCRSRTESPDAALEVLLPLTTNVNEDVAEEARKLAGQASVSAGDHQQALELLQGFTAPSLRRARAEAFVGLGRTDEALAEIDAIFEDADSVAIAAIDWRRLIRVVASRDSEDADSLVSRIARIPAVGDTSIVGLQLVVAEGMIESDREEAVRRLHHIALLQPSQSVSLARTLYVENRLTGVESPMELRRVLDSIGQLVRRDSYLATVAARAIASGESLLEDVEQFPAGSPDGDMALFMRAEIARDSLEAPRLAGYLFDRVAEGWPESPYLVKALLASLVLNPERADSIRALIDQHPESAYRLQLLGLPSPRFIALEDSLANYIADRMFAEAEARQLAPVTEVF